MHSSSSSRPRVAVYGTFDVLNYGDLLFPHLVRHALGPSSYDCIAISPTRTTLPWLDTLPTQAVEDAPALAARLHIIGGGNIIHARETPLATYETAALDRKGAYASLWLGAAMIAAQAEGRLAWNAPGVPHPLADGKFGRLRDTVLAASDYVSVRDAASAVFLGAPSSQDAVILPDTALDIAHVWPSATLREHARDAFRRRGVDRPEAWTVFHLNDRYLDGDVREAASLVSSIATAMGTVPVLVAFGPCHGDDVLARALGEHMVGRALIVDQPAGLKEIAALVAHSEGFVGSSLHGLITALSFGRPALSVARPRMVKFNGFLEQLGMADRLFGSWHDAGIAAPRGLMPLGEVDLAAIGRGRDEIGRHWMRLRSLAVPGGPTKASKVRRGLAQWIETGPSDLRDWRAFRRALDLPRAPALPLEVPQSAVCNICGESELRQDLPSPPDQPGGGAACKACGATARHRAMRVVFDTVREPGPSRLDCLRLGRNRVVAGGWFHSMRDIEIETLCDLKAVEDATADIVVCIDMLERAPDPACALRMMLRAARPGGFLFVALRNVPGADRTLDWGFPRGDREGEFRKFGTDAEQMIRAALPKATIVAAEPSDPVTGIRTRVFLASHGSDTLRGLAESGIPVQVIPAPETSPA